MSKPYQVRYRTTNWPAYNAILKHCGSMMVWPDLELQWFHRQLLRDDTSSDAKALGIRAYDELVQHRDESALAEGRGILPQQPVGRSCSADQWIGTAQTQKHFFSITSAYGLKHIRELLVNNSSACRNCIRYPTKLTNCGQMLGCLRQNRKLFKNLMLMM